MSDHTIHVELTIHEARALARASELMMDCFGREVRAELGVGPGETPLEVAAQRLAWAIERQEVLA